MEHYEKLLHFIWRHRLYHHNELRTVAGQSIKIIYPGVLNENAGPDFELSIIQIGTTTWSGHVEIHINEDDWIAHKHHLNPAYNATILHVVWESGKKDIYRQDGTLIPTLVLKNYVDQSLLQRYNHLMKQPSRIACAGQIGQISHHITQSWLERLSVERLEDRYCRVSNWLKATDQNWERVFLISLGRAFGTNVNAASFEQLFSQLDIKMLFRYADSPIKIEALLFGQAGFLSSDSNDAYIKKLCCIYNDMKKLHSLKEMCIINWKFLRMRPYNFPTFRLAQLAALLSHKSYWFDYICNEQDLRLILRKIKEVKLSKYWSTHYRPGKESRPHGVEWTDSFLSNLAINCFIPVLFSYGKYIGNMAITMKSLEWINIMPPERNSVISYYKGLGIISKNASDTQALLQLKKNYCERKLCLACQIGFTILKRMVN